MRIAIANYTTKLKVKVVTYTIGNCQAAMKFSTFHRYIGEHGYNFWTRETYTVIDMKCPAPERVWPYEMDK